ncbi:MAG: hypothetical protein AAF211_11105 [Myxococcota bacterium]
MQVLTTNLPSNPNCVLFTTDAEALFAHRTQGQLMREMMTLAAPMHGQSSLPVLVGLSWRDITDRRNQRIVLGTVFFVFDGPATAEDLDRLESTVMSGALQFDGSSIERVPGEVAWAGVWYDGRPHLVVELDPEPGNGRSVHAPWYVRAFTWDARYDPPVGVIAIDAESEDLPNWQRVTPGETAYSVAEENVERMRLAFALHHALRILHTTNSPTADRGYFDELFPPELVERLRLHDPNERWGAVEDARRILPQVLGHHDKLAMVGLLYSVCFSDGPLSAPQMRALRDAAHELGVTSDQVVRYIQRLW